MRIGPMYAQKTTWLNSELTKFADQGFSVLKIVHDDDKRPDAASNSLSGSTHNSSFTDLTKKVHYLRVRELASVDVKGYHMVGIDEAQFFSDLVVTVKRWIEEIGLNVLVAGLDGTFEKKPFGQVLALIPHSDECIKKVASCQLCLTQLEKFLQQGLVIGHMVPPAPFSLRLTKGHVDIEIGGKGKYMAVCRFHHAVEH
jgi:thymidine kinase